MEQKLKNVHITLKPQTEGGVVKTLKTTVVIEEGSYQKGDVFDSIPLSLASCQTAAYGAEDFELRDDDGAFTFTCEKTMGMFGPQYSYKFGRDAEGRIEISYSAKAAAKDPNKGDPGFSLFQNEGGCTAAGIAFLLLPGGVPFAFSLDYDLIEMAADSCGLCGHGEGTLRKDCTAWELKHTFYCLGPVYRYHREGSKLHLVWFQQEMPFIEEFCRVTSEYFDYMEKLFHDEDIPYHIILYPTPRTTLTGTALTRCCYMGLGTELIESVEEIEGSLAHELVHNWATITDQEWLQSLFAEGMAEYYCGYIAYQLGRRSLDSFAELINEKLRFFYSNPRCCDPFEEVHGQSWTHAYAQRISYGRGVLLMLGLDALIRKETGGAKSLDDVTVSLIDGGRNGQPSTWDAFVKLADSLSGGKARGLIEETLAGGGIIPPADYFGEGYVLKKGGILQEESGFDDRVKFENPRIVHGLKADSNAAKAGLRDGDILVSIPSEWDLASAPDNMAEYKVLRDCEELTIRYLPRGEEVPCWQYEKRR